ncbi:Pyrimidine 5-nucleotidase, eukaryotic [Sesbania bispinosa]|nr:Pyrimidine 5-nucleotidase, eukaryotic [Sesbania bispinosa]
MLATRKPSSAQPFAPRTFPFPAFPTTPQQGCESRFRIVGGRSCLLEKKIDAIRLAGPQKLQVIADFDATLTKFWVNGTRGLSSHGLLQQGNPEYDAKRQQLYEYYHPLEFSPTIGLEEKTKLMEEWWGKTHALLIEGGLTYESIRQSVANANIAFREGLADIIEEVLRQKLHRSFKKCEDSIQQDGI